MSKGPKYREPVSYSWHQNFSIIMDACEEYARRWAKKEDVEVDTLSEWIKSIADVLKRRIQRRKHSVNTRHESIFSDPDVVRELSRLHENFVIVPADKASNNYTFVCKRHYVRILSEELGLNSLPGNPTYNLTDFSASEVLDNYKSVLTSFEIETTNQTFHQFHDLDTELDLHRLWVVSMEHLQRVWHASRERLPFRTPGSVPILGLANAPIVETKLLELAMSLLDFSPRIPLGTFSILLIDCYKRRKFGNPWNRPYKFRLFDKRWTDEKTYFCVLQDSYFLVLVSFCL